MKDVADLCEGTRILSASNSPDLAENEQKLSSVQLKKEDLLKRVMLVEMEINNKEKELKKARK